jgi:FO synthase
MAQFEDLQLDALLQAIQEGHLPGDEEALALAEVEDTARLAKVAAAVRDRGHGAVISYSRKVFIPLTHLCRDVCHYCTFAQTPRHIPQAYMSVEQVLELCREGERMGCKEALFTLGERPELRYKAARDALDELGFATTLEYVAHVAGRVLEETSLLPHINAGCMDEAEFAMLRPVSASMGIMLESASARLCEKGMPHYGSPDKEPARRLETIALAGKAAVPFTSGILIGIGETRKERIESLLELRALNAVHGQLQELIVQNFRAKEGTLMASAAEPNLDELLWTIAVARLVFGAHMNIQAPPNLSPGVLPQIVQAGINDWGGVSPVTPDYVNPEAPWPHLDKLAQETASAGKYLQERLTLYPSYAADGATWLDEALQLNVLQRIDAQGFPRTDEWSPGSALPPPAAMLAAVIAESDPDRIGMDVREIVARCEEGAELTEADVERLFLVRGEELSYVCQRADKLRKHSRGEQVSYVVNRNINYTNICYFKCQFCAFSKGKLSENLRGRPYDLDADEIARRCSEAWQRGATEVCMQGGIHPEYTGQTYLDILATVKAATPDMHIHAFSPLEVWQGAETLGLDLEEYLQRLRDAGLDTLPGTAAEILDDEVRAILCPDKINTEQWLQVMESAHRVGFRTTATIMYGHVEKPAHWARHLLRVRQLQQRTGGFTEFVPLPFVHMEAPMYLKGQARKGPTFREALLMHAVARLVFNGLIDNIQTSWVKMGEQGVAACLQAGANDLGGTLMNETITRAAGAGHGQEWSPQRLEQQIGSLGREPRQRNTVYGDVPAERRQAASVAQELSETINTPARKYERKTPSEELVRNEVIASG